MPHPVTHNDVEQFIAVVDAAFGIDDYNSIGVAVERDAVVGALLSHRGDQRRGRRGADAGVDVVAVGVGGDGGEQKRMGRWTWWRDGRRDCRRVGEDLVEQNDAFSHGARACLLL